MMWEFMLLLDGERRDAPEMSTHGKGDPTTSTSAYASSSELVMASFMSPYPTTIASAIDLIHFHKSYYNTW